MKSTLPLLLAGTAAVAALGLLARTETQAAPRPAQTVRAQAGRVPVIVELFTSEGCSSCPPADASLSRLESQTVGGADVIALGEHVDYWNHGGWADPFSANKFSARQSDYSRSFGLDNVYTPQMVVDGKAQFVGGDDDEARAAIARAARQPKADVSVTASGTDAVSVQVAHVPPAAHRDPADVLLAVTEDGLTSSVRGGENAGRRLAYSAVVRRLVPLGTVQGGAFTARTPLDLSANWRRGRLRAVVFVQERGSRRIIGASEVSL